MLKAIGGVLVGLASLTLVMPATAAAQTQATSTKPLPADITAQLQTALTLTSITLGVLEVRLEQQQMILDGANQQLGIVANSLTLLQNPAFLDTDAKRTTVSQIIKIDAQVVGLVKDQVDLVSQERSNQLSTLGQLTDKFKSLTQVIVDWRKSS